MEVTNKFEIKIDPLDLHIGLKDNMAEFESLIRMPRPGASIAEKIEKDLNSRFCHCCFFGHVECELMGEPLCKECAKILYGFDANEERPSIKKIDPYYQLYYRRQKALPIFEAYLHSEIERYKLEQKLENVKATNYTESVDAGMENRRLKRALWLARAELCHRLDVDRYLRKHRNSWYNENCLTWAEACEAMELKMCKAESKCRDKAEEY